MTSLFWTVNCFHIFRNSCQSFIQYRCTFIHANVSICFVFFIIDEGYPLLIKWISNTWFNLYFFCIMSANLYNQSLSQRTKINRIFIFKKLKSICLFISLSGNKQHDTLDNVQSAAPYHKINIFEAFFFTVCSTTLILYVAAPTSAWQSCVSLDLDLYAIQNYAGKNVSSITEMSKALRK